MVMKTVSFIDVVKAYERQDAKRERIIVAARVLAAASKIKFWEDMGVEITALECAVDEYDSEYDDWLNRDEYDSDCNS